MRRDVPHKYALTHIRAGDYLLLSDDGATLWRIATYTEDGSAIENGTNRALTGKFWGTWKYTKPLTGTVDTESFDGFEMDGCLFKSRAEAIADVLYDR